MKLFLRSISAKYSHRHLSISTPDKNFQGDLPGDSSSHSLPLLETCYNSQLCFSGFPVGTESVHISLLCQGHPQKRRLYREERRQWCPRETCLQLNWKWTIINHYLALNRLNPFSWTLNYITKEELNRGLGHSHSALFSLNTLSSSE